LRSLPSGETKISLPQRAAEIANNWIIKRQNFLLLHMLSDLPENKCTLPTENLQDTPPGNSI